MLFNSYAFLFAFLPITLIGYQIAGYFHRRAVVAWLGFMSLAFYAYWRPILVVLLVSSIAVNYSAAILISREPSGSPRSRLWMWSAIVIDLGTLGYFKYLFPALNFISSATHSQHHWSNIILPLGISFFTFTQIAYVVDLQQGIATRQDIFSYVLFVTFFPHLIAGPILHHKEIMPQFSQHRNYRLQWDDLSVGFSWFIMGLGKKVLFADTLFAGPANTAFAIHGPLPFALAWRGVLSYALQLYFDFSGYSDMALGLARMFSLNFPLNFSSPYKATNIIDFWYRWHITLTQYITSYLYTPVQAAISRRRVDQGKKISRKALATPEGFVNLIAVPTIFTMFVAGVWHGAGFQFIIFGLLHGAYITTNHCWRVFGPKSDPLRPSSRFVTASGHVSSLLLTLLCVVIADVFFRAGSTGHALSIVGSMAGMHGLGLHRLFPDETAKVRLLQLAELAFGFTVVWTMPNTQQILARFKPALQVTPWDEESQPRYLLWTPRLSWALGLGCVFFAVLVQLQDPSSFLYFQF